MSVETATSHSPKRPILVWIICIFYLFSFVSAIFNFFVVIPKEIAGSIPVDEALRRYLGSLTAFDYLFQGVMNLVNLAGTILLFSLRRSAFNYLLYGSLVLPILYFIYDSTFGGLLTVFPSRTATIIFIAGIIVCYSISIAVLAYIRHLCVINVLR
jgi:hypothetical protein